MAGLPEHSPLRPKGSNESLAAARRAEAEAFAATAYLDGQSPAWRRMADWVRRVAPTRLPALVLGESGAGKEGVARALHALSTRREGPFLALNCAAVTDSLLDVELFGATRGAYTSADRSRTGLFERAGGGTLFLDEVAEMSAAMQARLLRVLESRRFRPVGSSRESVMDVRLVAATNCDLVRATGRGEFREDLYFRLAVAEVHVPPLRERLLDLRDLVASLAERLRADTGHGPPRLDAAAWRVLETHPWPGNVRELHTTLARALLRANAARITPDDLGPLGGTGAPGGTKRPPAIASQRQALERGMIRNALRKSDGNVARAARQIGWTRQKLYRRLDALGLRVPPRSLFDDP